jgi:hypothetical protein
MKKEIFQIIKTSKNNMEFNEELQSEENRNGNFNKCLNKEDKLDLNSKEKEKSFFDRVYKDSNSNSNEIFLKDKETDKSDKFFIKTKDEKFNKNKSFKINENFNYYQEEKDSRKEINNYENTINLKKIDYPNVDLNDIIINEKNYSVEYHECKIKF